MVLCLQIKKRACFPWHVERKGSEVKKMSRGGDLRSFPLRRVIINLSVCVYQIINLCVNVHGYQGPSVAGVKRYHYLCLQAWRLFL